MIYSLTPDELVDLIRIFVADPDYEVRRDHIEEQMAKVRKRRTKPAISDPERRKVSYDR